MHFASPFVLLHGGCKRGAFLSEGLLVGNLVTNIGFRILADMTKGICACIESCLILNEESWMSAFLALGANTY